jgi:hypothetical protein
METAIEDDMPEPRHMSNIIHGPNGWTESFDAQTVDVLLRMGAIRLVNTTSAAGWQTNFYDTIGRFEEKK